MKHTSTKVLPTRNKLNYDVPLTLLKKKGFYLYQITNNFDDKVYVGYTSQKPITRISQHAYRMQLGYAQNGRSYLYPAAFKHGIENFTYTLLAVFDSEASGLKAEDDLVEQYKAEGYTVYNIVPGGGGCGSGENHPLYGKTGELCPNYGRTLTNEHKAKISLATAGENNPMYGKTGEHSPNYGKPCSAETKTKIGAAQKGEKNHMYKYDPVLIASYASQKEATAATGISQPSYSRLKIANPNLTWPAPLRASKKKI
jgi:group I intron endonuclease